MGKKTSALTAKSVEQARWGNTRREIPDGGCPGLFLIVQPSGTKSWALRFRSPVERDANGQRKAKKLTLGTVAETPSDVEPAIGHPLTLGQARMLATRALEDVRRDIDPTAVRRQEKVAAKIKAMTDNTVDAAMVEFLRRYKGKKKQGLRESTRNLTAHYLGLRPDPENPGEWLKRTNGGVLASWSGRALVSITKRDAIALLDGLVDAGIGVTANRTLTNLKMFFDWCVKRDLLDASPVASLDALAEEVSRDRVLSDTELAALWRVADAEGYPFGRMVQLIALTGARRDEMREAVRTEFDLDSATVTLPSGAKWSGPLWMLPAARSKNRREHVVPLAPTAVRILKNLPRIGRSPLLFTTTGTTPISGLSGAKKRLDAAMLAELQKTDPDYILASWSLHDLRRTFYSGLQRLGFSVEVAEEAVNHKSGTRSGVAAVYARHRYVQEKAAAFDAWARHVDGLVNGRDDDNVVEFQKVQA